MVRVAIDGMTGTKFCRVFFARLVCTILLLSFSKRIIIVESGYTKCNLGKGIGSKLYNCGSKYNDGNDQSNLGQQTTPTRCVRVRVHMTIKTTEISYGF